MTDRLEAQFAFLNEADKLKSVLRATTLVDGSRRENSGEHSWHLALYALVLADQAAPGVDIIAAAPKGAYDISSGTSMAAAHVSGIAALMLEKNPKLTPKDIRALLLSSAYKTSGQSADLGAGIADAAGALAAVK